MEATNTIYIQSPLKGYWAAPHTPGDRVPSHGTDALGQRYAYDFFQLDHDSNQAMKFYKSSKLKYWTIGVPLADCYCYEAPIYASVAGKVVEVVDGFKEPKRLHPLLDPLKVVGRTWRISIQSLFTKDIEKLIKRFIGNYVIIEFDQYYAFFAHVVPGSIKVKPGDMVKADDVIAAVGHSGNSTAPHLHFHVMDRKDLLHAEGIKAGFKQYGVVKNNDVIIKENDIPLKDEQIKFI